MVYRASASYSVYCMGCGSYCGNSSAKLSDEPEEWVCNVCMTRFHPNARGYTLGMIRHARHLEEIEYIRDVQAGNYPDQWVG